MQQHILQQVDFFLKSGFEFFDSIKNDLSGNGGCGGECFRERHFLLPFGIVVVVFEHVGDVVTPDFLQSDGNHRAVAACYPISGEFVWCAEQQGAVEQTLRDDGGEPGLERRFSNQCLHLLQD